MALPLLVAGVLLVVNVPLSCLVRHDPGDTMRLLLGSLATPILLAIPAGMAFSRPTHADLPAVGHLSLPEPADSPRLDRHAPRTAGPGAVVS
jgi:hypothetical protein